MAEKQKFKKNPHNYAIKKTSLLKQKVSVSNLIKWMANKWMSHWVFQLCQRVITSTRKGQMTELQSETNRVIAVTRIFSITESCCYERAHMNTWCGFPIFPMHNVFVFLYMLLLSAWYFIFEYIWLTGNGRLGGRYCSSVQNLPGAGRTRREGQWTGQKKNQ